MKSILLATSVLVLVFAAGCKPTTQKATVPSAKTTSQQLDKAQAATKDVANQMRDYNFAQRTEYVAAMQLELDAINRELDLLSAQVDKSSAATKAEATPRIKALREQTAALSKQLDQAKNATESTWDEVKAGFNKGFTELKDGFNKARQWTSEKIAP